MSEYTGACQDLGFLCDWQSTAATRQDVVLDLVVHLNQVHGTGSTSPALGALIGRYISETPAGDGKPAHLRERAS